MSRESLARLAAVYDIARKGEGDTAAPRLAFRGGISLPGIHSLGPPADVFFPCECGVRRMLTVNRYGFTIAVDEHGEVHTCEYEPPDPFRLDIRKQRDRLQAKQWRGQSTPAEDNELNRLTVAIRLEDDLAAAKLRRRKELAAAAKVRYDARKAAQAATTVTSEEDSDGN
jgi:hypothetical protein